jgi:hypothetical protein
MTETIEFIKLQEILLQRIHEQESKILERVKTYQDVNDKKINQIENELDLQKSRSMTQQEMINSHKLFIDKIPDLEKSQSLNAEDTFANKCKIMTLEKDLSAATKKYDKMYFDNLILPGVIGDGNRYKNVREYLDVNNLFNI